MLRTVKLIQIALTELDTSVCQALLGKEELKVTADAYL